MSDIDELRQQIENLTRANQHQQTEILKLRLGTFERAVEQLVKDLVDGKVRDLQAVAQAAREVERVWSSLPDTFDPPQKLAEAVMAMGAGYVLSGLVAEAPAETGRRCFRCGAHPAPLARCEIVGHEWTEPVAGGAANREVTP